MPTLMATTATRKSSWVPGEDELEEAGQQAGADEINGGEEDGGDGE